MTSRKKIPAVIFDKENQLPGFLHLRGQQAKSLAGCDNLKNLQSVFCIVLLCIYSSGDAARSSFV